MMNAAERAWDKFNQYEIEGLTVTEEPGRIVFEQKDPIVRYDRVWTWTPIGALSAIPCIFVGLGLMRAGWPFIVTFAPFFFCLFGLVIVAQHVFIPTRRLEITKGMVIFKRGWDVRMIPVEDIRSIDVSREQHSMPSQAADEYGLIAIWDGPFATYTLYARGYSTGIALKEGIKAAIEIMNPVASANPSPALPGRRRPFAE